MNQKWELCYKINKNYVRKIKIKEINKTKSEIQIKVKKHQFLMKNLDSNESYTKLLKIESKTIFILKKWMKWNKIKTMKKLLKIILLKLNFIFQFVI